MFNWREYKQIDQLWYGATFDEVEKVILREIEHAEKLPPEEAFTKNFIIIEEQSYDFDTEDFTVYWSEYIHEGDGRFVVLLHSNLHREGEEVRDVNLYQGVETISKAKFDKMQHLIDFGNKIIVNIKKQAVDSLLSKK